MSQKIIKRIVIIAVITASVSLTGWYFFFSPDAQIKAVKNKKERVFIVSRHNLNQTLTISGEIEAEEKTVLRFQSSGMLSWVGVKVGDTVKKYQAIASLDQRELQKNLEKYLLAYMKSRWDFEQTKDEYRQPAQEYWGLTWDQRNDIDRALQKAQFDLNSSVLDVELKDLTLKYAVMISPIDGIVTRVESPHAGVNVTPTQAEIEIINPNSLYLSVLADQTEVTKLIPGMPASLVFDAFPDQIINASIKEISFTPKTGESGTVYEAKILLPKENQTSSFYRMGMTGDATFTLNERRDVLAIQDTAIKNEGEKKYVYRQVNNKKEKTYIETGIETDTLIEITSGLAPGDIIYD